MEEMMTENLELNFLKRNLELIIQFSKFWNNKTHHFSEKEIKELTLFISDAKEELTSLEGSLIEEYNKKH